MIWIGSSIEEESPNQTVCLSIAVAFHALLFFWNPMLFTNAWRAQPARWDHGIIVIDLPGTESPKGLRMPDAPHKTPFSPIGAPLLIPKYFHKVHAAMPGPPAQSLSTDAESPVPIPLGKTAENATVLVERPNLHQNSRILIPRSLKFPQEGSGIPLGADNGISQLEQSKGPLTGLAIEQTPRQKGPPIEGPLSHRAVMHRVIPDYPVWAEEQGITGTTRLYFTVAPGGRVESDIRVVLTSGSPELDQLAIEALRAWRFVPSHSQDGSQWGTITFFFSLGRE